MVSERADAKASLHGRESPGSAPQFSDNQPGGIRTFRQETDGSRMQRAAGRQQAANPFGC
jgi:hypothetical protein